MHLKELYLPLNLIPVLDVHKVCNKVIEGWGQLIDWRDTEERQKATADTRVRNASIRWVQLI